jgi:hypothetical protein
MGQFSYRGVDRANQLNGWHDKHENIIAVIDENGCLTIFTRDPEVYPVVGQVSRICKKPLIHNANGIIYEIKHKNKEKFNIFLEFLCDRNIKTEYFEQLYSRIGELAGRGFFNRFNVKSWFIKPYGIKKGTKSGWIILNNEWLEVVERLNL